MEYLSVVGTPYENFFSNFLLEEKMPKLKQLNPISIEKVSKY
jgi:hypothetical protein